MSRLHDMGGRFGDGAVVPEAETPVFHQDWHARALALTVASGSLGQWNLDISRHARESLPPQDYISLEYYEIWLAGLANLLVDTGTITREELQGVTAGSLSDLAEKCLKPEQVAAGLANGGPADRPSDIAPIFAPGDIVQTRKLAENAKVSGGHTRQPAYVAGARGRIMRYHGTHILPDSNAHGFGEAAEPLYAVVFNATELWTHPEHPDDEVVLDLWQSYLVAG